jgi:hypothetical protein
MHSLDDKLQHLVISAVADDLAKTHGKKLREKIDNHENSFGEKKLNPLSDSKAFEHITSHDPTPKGSYKKWLAHTYVNGGIRYAEDLPRAKAALTLFDKHKANLPKKGFSSDIQHYKDLPSLEKSVEHLKDKEHEDNSWSAKSGAFR